MGVEILRRKEERLVRECQDKENRIEGLERKVVLYQENAQGWTQRVWVVEERSRQTKELLVARSAELAEAQAFLSTTDNLSGEEAGIVRDLNENMYQVAADLTEEWEKFESLHSTGPMGVDPTSQPCTPPTTRIRWV